MSKKKIKLPRHSLVIDLANTKLSDSEINRIKHPAVAGVILFTRNFSDSAQLKGLIKEIRALTFPEFLIAVDHEGGRVQRFRDDEFTHLPSMQCLTDSFAYQGDNWRQVIQDIGWLMAAECLYHGINLSFAPVLDIEGGSDVIGDRAFSRDPEKVSDVAAEFIKGMVEAGMPSVAKHFPGHGSTKLDSHIHAPKDQRSLQNIIATDLRPFHDLIGKNVIDSVMPAHIVFTAVDNLPVGYSKKWLNDMLREKLHFKGAVFSDDLSMVGAGLSREHPISYVQRVNKAFEAGCNFALICNNPDEVDALLADSNILESDQTISSEHIGNAFLKKASFAGKAEQFTDIKSWPRYQKTKTLITKIRMN